MQGPAASGPGVAVREVVRLGRSCGHRLRVRGEAGCACRVHRREAPRRGRFRQSRGSLCAPSGTSVSQGTGSSITRLARCPAAGACGRQRGGDGGGALRQGWRPAASWWRSGCVARCLVSRAWRRRHGRTAWLVSRPGARRGFPLHGSCCSALRGRRAQASRCSMPLLAERRPSPASASELPVADAGSLSGRSLRWHARGGTVGGAGHAHCR